MAKINNDKYYTPIETANHCWDVIDKKIGLNNISSIIEPSVGNGAFCNYKVKPDLCIDILPEIKGENIIQADFLEYKLEYEKNRLIIGNPPFGDKLHLAVKFYNKAVEIADYIAFILPISQLNNHYSFYKFDLIYSEDLGLLHYSDRELKCCFNIYKRPENGKLNKKTLNRIKGITIYREDCKGFKEITDYDIRMCYWGSGIVGKILSPTDKDYAGEYKIKVDDSHPYKKEIINLIKTYDWKGYLSNSISMKSLMKYQLLEVIRKEIPKVDSL